MENTKYNIDVGLEIRDKIFQGNIYSQDSIIRRCLFALKQNQEVIINHLNLTENEVIKQNQELFLKFEEINSQIENILKIRYPEEYLEKE